MKHLFLRVLMEARQVVSLPDYSGSTLRGALNMALKAQSCGSPRECALHCGSPHECGYGYLCETPVFEHAPKRLKASRFLPHPVVVHPPAGKRTLAPGDVLMFNMTVLESAFVHLPTLVSALEQMARDGFGKSRGCLTLRRIEQVETHDVLYLDGKRFWTNCSPSELWDSNANIQGSRLSLMWYTPLHLQIKKQMVTTLTVKELMYAAATRLEMLWGIYAPDAPSPVDAKQMLALGDEMVMIEHQMQTVQHTRWSNRKEHKHTLKGLVGQVTLVGQLENYWPTLRAAQRLHLGKKTSMAQGAFECYWSD